MIHLNINIGNPWSKQRFKSLVSKSWRLTKHKAVECEVTWSDYTVAGYDFHLTFRRDHAGVRSDVTALGMSFSFDFYDTRHWDYSKGEWETYND